jgi:uncharacterized coiled-coil DUF342 family protein
MEQMMEQILEGLLAIQDNEKEYNKKIEAFLQETKSWREEMTACQEERDTCLESKEPPSVQIESIAVHQEVPKEGAVVNTVRALKKRHGDRHLPVEHPRKPKKWTQGDGGSQEKLTVA